MEGWRRERERGVGRERRREREIRDKFLKCSGKIEIEGKGVQKKLLVVSTTQVEQNFIARKY